MSPASDEHAELAAEAERALRRGELREALILFRRLAARAPGDARLASRIKAIEASMQPSELLATPAPSADDDAEYEKPLTLEQMAEMLFDGGDLEGSLGAYARIIEARPDNQLARERYDEIEQLLSVSRPDKPAGSKAAPPVQAPQSREDALQALLGRITARRR